MGSCHEDALVCTDGRTGWLLRARLAVVDKPDSGDFVARCPVRARLSVGSRFRPGDRYVFVWSVGLIARTGLRLGPDTCVTTSSDRELLVRAVVGWDDETRLVRRTAARSRPKLTAPDDCRATIRARPEARYLYVAKTARDEMRRRLRNPGCPASRATEAGHLTSPPLWKL